MIDLNPSLMNKIAIHKIGQAPDQVWLSHKPVNVDTADTSQNLLALLIKGFNKEIEYHIPQESVVKNEIDRMFNQPGLFQEISGELAVKYAQTHDPDTIREGEFIVMAVNHILYEGERRNGMIIMKTDTREDFLILKKQNDTYDLALSKGIPLKRIDKCVMIINVHGSDGYRCLFKKINFNAGENHFVDEFIKARPLPSSYYNTSSYFNMVRTFVNDEMEAENKLDKVEKLNRSMDYLKNHESLNASEFENEVFDELEKREAFQNFRKNYSNDNELEITDEFEISPKAVRHNNRYIRSVIKLDRNFHIYVHGNRQHIVRGFDHEKNMHYYQLFFDKES